MYSVLYLSLVFHAGDGTRCPAFTSIIYGCWYKGYFSFESPCPCLQFCSESFIECIQKMKKGGAIFDGQKPLKKKPTKRYFSYLP